MTFLQELTLLYKFFIKKAGKQELFYLLLKHVNLKHFYMKNYLSINKDLYT